MKRWMIVLFILGIMIMTLVLANLHAFGLDAVCLQTGSTATPTTQQKASGHICTDGIPRQVHSQTQP